MSYVSIIIVGIMVIFALVGIIDKLFFNDKYGYGSEFQRGLEMIGPLCISIVGIIALVPIISYLLQSTLSPLYKTFGLDPSMAITTILAIDMGGFQLAESIATSDLIGKWAGVVYGSMMGATIVFSIPVGLGTISKEDVSAFSKGILFGIAAIPVGTFIGGLVLGINVIDIIKNLIIPIIISALIILCLIKKPKETTNVFAKFGEIINFIALIGLGLAILKDLVLLPLSEAGLFDISKVFFFNLLGSTSEGISVAGSVGLVLAGALPFVAWLQKTLNKPLKKLSDKLNISEAGCMGILLSSANNMAMFATLSKMSEKERIINVAFAVPAAFVIGDHLAFTAANAPDCIVPMIIAKLVSGIIAIIIASFFTKEINK